MKKQKTTKSAKKGKALPKYKQRDSIEPFKIKHHDAPHAGLKQIVYSKLTLNNQTLGAIQFEHGLGDYGHKKEDFEMHKILHHAKLECTTLQLDNGFNGYPSNLKRKENFAQTPGEFDVCVEKTDQKHYQMHGQTYSVKKECQAKNDICHWHIVASDSASFDRVLDKLRAVCVDPNSGEVQVPIVDNSATHPISTFFHNDELAAFLKRCMQQQPRPDDDSKFMDPHNNDDWLAYLQYVDDNDTYGLVTHGSFFPANTSCSKELSSLGET